MTIPHNFDNLEQFQRYLAWQREDDAEQDRLEDERARSKAKRDDAPDWDGTPDPHAEATRIAEEARVKGAGNPAATYASSLLEAALRGDPRVNRSAS